MIPRSGSDDHKIPFASPASLSSPLTLLSLSQCLGPRRHPWRNDKSPLVLCHTELLCKPFVMTSTSSPQLVLVIQLLPLTIYQSRELFGAAPVSICQVWIHPASPLILAWSSCACINPFLWSLNLEPPGGRGCPPPSSFHRTRWEGSLWYRGGRAEAGMKMRYTGLGKGAVKLVHPQPYTNTSSPTMPALPSHCSPDTDRSGDRAPALTQSPLADVRPGCTTNNELRVIH